MSLANVPRQKSENKSNCRDHTQLEFERVLVGERSQQAEWVKIPGKPNNISITRDKISNALCPLVEMVGAALQERKRVEMAWKETSRIADAVCITQLT